MCTGLTLELGHGWRVQGNQPVPSVAHRARCSSCQLHSSTLEWAFPAHFALGSERLRDLPKVTQQSRVGRGSAWLPLVASRERCSLLCLAGGGAWGQALVGPQPRWSLKPPLDLTFVGTAQRAGPTTCGTLPYFPTGGDLGRCS